MATETERDEGVRRVYKDHNLHVLWGVTLMGPRDLERNACLSNHRTGVRHLQRTGWAPDHVLHTPRHRDDPASRHSLRPLRKEEDLGPRPPPFSLHNPEPRNDDRLRDYFGSVWENLYDREVFGLICASLLTFIVLFGPQISYLPILMNARFDAPSYVIGAVLSGASLTTALTSTQLGRLTGRFSEKGLLKTAFVLYAIALIAVALVPSLPLLVFPAALFGVAQGINLPNVFSLLNSHAPTENRGAFMAANGMSLRAGQTIGPLFMASAAGTLGLTGAYLAAASLALFAFLLVLALVRP